MEIFYTRLGGGEENEAEWANLRTLLLSEDAENLQIGLSILGGAPQNCAAVADALCVRLIFEAETDENAPYRQRISVLLNTYLPKAQRRALEEDLALFLPTNAQTQSWATVAARLHRYEQVRAHYEPLILQNALFAKRFFSVATLFIYGYEQREAALPFLELAMERLPNWVAPFLNWADVYTLHLFPAAKFWEQADKAEAVFEHILQLKPHYAPLVAYKRAFMAQTLRRKGWQQLARAGYEQALAAKLDAKTRENISEWLLAICVEQGDYVRAAELVQALTPSLGIDKLAIPLALVAWKLHNNREAAATLLKKTAAKEPQNAQLSRYLSQLYAEMGEVQASAFYAEQADKIDSLKA